MKPRWRFRSLIFSLLLVVALVFVSGVGSNHQTVANASRRVYDLSEWQGPINDQKAHNLKKEVSFVILRAQYGRNYQDRQFSNSVSKMTKHHVPYGVYGYSLYHNRQDARKEATALYYRAPKANFYVNDIEQNNAGRRIGSATIAWAKTMKRLTTRPVVLYSYSNFIHRYLRHSTKYYDAIWLANYAKRRPTADYKYDLWQFTSRHYSKALRKRIDASILTGKKPLSFWIGKHGKMTTVNPVTPSSVNNQTTPVKRNNKQATKHSVRWNWRKLHRYHYEMRKASRTLKHGRRLSRGEVKALRIYKLRHGHAYRL